MITITIGTNGRLGNQMFQYASLMGIADKQNLIYGVDYFKGSSESWDKFPDDILINQNTFILPKAFQLSALQCDEKYKIKNETTFHFDSNMFDIDDDIQLHGYFQTEKYFKHIESKVRSEFTFRPDIIKCSHDYLKDKINYETVAIHVRRGDYLLYPHHGTCDLRYYTSALEQFTDKNYNFIVMTDDIEWAKSTFSGNDNFFISESKNQFIDMCIMTICNHNIIANSTFSWWGAWLNKNTNKKVIAPHKWFGGSLDHLNTNDLMPEKWIRL